jgi:hypothetical protein
MFEGTNSLFNTQTEDYEDWTRFQVRASWSKWTGSKCEDLKSNPVRIGNDISYE